MFLETRGMPYCPPPWKNFEGGRKVLAEDPKNTEKKHFGRKKNFPQPDTLDKYNGVLTSMPENCQLNTKIFPLKIPKLNEKKTLFPETIDPQSVSMDMRNGVLTTRSNVSPQAPKKIEKNGFQVNSPMDT